MKAFSSVLLAASASLLLVSCGETFIEVAARHQSDLEKLRADLTKLGELVAANPTAKEPASPLDPAPAYKKDDTANSNTSIIAWERLADPNKEFKTDELMDFYLSNGLENCFEWATWDKKAFDNFEPTLRQVCSLRYLVTYKPVQYKAPVVDENLNYTIGSAASIVHVFDREKQEIVCSFHVVAASDEKVNYTYTEGGDQLGAARSWARSSLWENLRNRTVEVLAAKTGGSFAL